ncbi:hypothetical protein ASA1KI_03190 [Opitutales bacterium ASA1]|uniref:Gfo/Idh/MocA family protein n=1 Tax=Congregicoccus parvus TaxID=3081749 RepID=UPI002B2C28FE|nr:hypothetical protein ASA1KI_03190 [Opitutales bacterium ASA1]
MAHRPKLSWGILGPGGIAGTFAAGLRESESGRLEAVASRSIEKARVFAKTHGAGRAYGSYEDLLASPEVDAVYIALPNALHAEWTERCARAGKHILCEKPAAVNHGEALRALAAVKEAKVFYMEAFMYRCHPQTERLVALVRDGEIGEVRQVHAHFAYDLRGGVDNVRMSHALAGGSIMDVGCYPMSMARLIAGAAGGNPFQNPVDVRGVAHLGERSRVDEAAVGAVKFPGGLVAAISCGMQGETEHIVRIWGSEGHIVVPAPWKPPQRDARLLVHKRGRPAAEEILIQTPAPLYAHEADRVAHAIRTGDHEVRAPGMSWADTLGNMAALDAWRAAVGLTFVSEGR